MEEIIRSNNNIIIENRKKFNISGVKDVISFDEETIVFESVLGRLVLKGSGMHIQSYDAETGDLFGEGRINAAVYTADEKNGGFFSRIFRWLCGK